MREARSVIAEYDRVFSDRQEVTGGGGGVGRGRVYHQGGPPRTGGYGKWDDDDGRGGRWI